MVVFSRFMAAILLAVWVCGPVFAGDDEEREGGIIGTGIVGTITHLGSVHVNGLHIRIDDALPVAGAVPPIAAGALRPGHTVAIIATHDGEGWTAQSIRQVLPLVGEVTASDAGELTVLGTRIETTGLSQDVDVGDWIAVSGLWQQSKVIASRIDVLADADHLAQVSGSYLGADPSGNVLVGGTVITGINPQHLQPGDLVRVTGRPEPGGVAATHLETGLFHDTVGVVQVQGYFSEPLSSGLYTVLGSGLVAYTSQPAMIDTGFSVVQCGQEGILNTEFDRERGETVQDGSVLSALNC